MSFEVDLTNLKSAIANAEGFGKPGAIPTLANNPGDLVLGDIGYGTMGAGITVFPDLTSGSNALSSQLTKILNGTSSNYSPTETLSQMGATYAGASGGSTWASNVAKFLGLTPDATIAQAAGATPSTGSASSPGVVASVKSSTALATVKAIASYFFGGSDSIASVGTDYLSRSVIIVVGLLFVGGGLLLFKPTQNIIIAGANVAKKGIKFAGETAEAAA